MIDLFTRAAPVAVLLLSGCAAGSAQLQQDLASTRAELRTLQRENTELTRRVEALSVQVDVLAARSARPASPASSIAPTVVAPPAVTTAPVPATPSVAVAAAAPAAVDEAVVIPSHLKVVRLEPSAAPPASKGARSQAAPAVPTAIPIKEPSPAALAALTASAAAPADAGATLSRARSLTGLPRARALEQFADAFPRDPRACDALVDAARTRMEVGDPDGSCEDLSRAVAEVPAARSLPEALEGLAACELRRGRPEEASRLQARLVKDFPDSPAGKRAREPAPAGQGASP